MGRASVFRRLAHIDLTPIYTPTDSFLQPWVAADLPTKNFLRETTGLKLTGPHSLACWRLSKLRRVAFALRRPVNCRDDLSFHRAGCTAALHIPPNVEATSPVHGQLRGSTSKLQIPMMPYEPRVGLPLLTWATSCCRWEEASKLTHSSRCPTYLFLTHPRRFIFSI